MEAPNKAYVGDMTYITTDEGWLYLLTAADLLKRKFVVWSMNSKITRKFVIDVCRQKNRGEGLFSSYRGVQYACIETLSPLLKKKRLYSTIRDKSSRKYKKDYYAALKSYF